MRYAALRTLISNGSYAGEDATEAAWGSSELEPDSF